MGISAVGVVLMALGEWLNFTAENEVLKTIYIMAVIFTNLAGWFLLWLISRLQSPDE